MLTPSCVMSQTPCPFAHITDRETEAERSCVRHLKPRSQVGGTAGVWALGVWIRFWWNRDSFWLGGISAGGEARLQRRVLGEPRVLGRIRCEVCAAHAWCTRSPSESMLTADLMLSTVPGCRHTAADTQLWTKKQRALALGCESLEGLCQS